MSYKKKKQLSYMIIGCLVIVAFACRHISVNNTYLRHFANQCRSSIYIGLYSAWVIYLEKHVVDMKMRRCLTQIGLFAGCTVITILVFAVIYGIIYGLTARTYYKIVERR